MIIFGSRMYGKRNVVAGWGRCEACGHYGQLSNYNARKWGHIYYIPLIPSGPTVRVVKECPKCRRGFHIPESDIDATLGEMRSSADAAIDALASGAETFHSDGSGEPEDCTGAIVGPIEFLLCLDGREHADHIARRLGEVQRGFEQQLVKAAISEFDGDVRGAAGAYETAARLDETNAAPLLLAGDSWFAAGELERALEAFRRASAIVPENLGPLLGMIDVYAAQDDHWQVSEIYERVFSIAPELRSEKKAVKAYKKSCKKANRPVQVV